MKNIYDVMNTGGETHTHTHTPHTHTYRSIKGKFRFTRVETSDTTQNCTYCFECTMTAKNYPAPPESVFNSSTGALGKDFSFSF